MTKQEIAVEMSKCRRSFAYWLKTYHTYRDAVDGKPKHMTKLSDVQKAMRSAVGSRKRVNLAVRKKRQIGASTMAIAAVMWRMIFRNKDTAGIVVSRSAECAYYLFCLAREEYENLPGWMSKGLGANLAIKKQQLGWLHFASANSLSTTRGNVYGVIYADELDWWERPNDFTEILLPKARMRNALVIVVSTKIEEGPSPISELVRFARKPGSGWVAVA